MSSPSLSVICTAVLPTATERVRKSTSIGIRESTSRSRAFVSAISSSSQTCSMPSMMSDSRPIVCVEATT